MAAKHLTHQNFPIKNHAEVDSSLAVAVRFLIYKTREFQVQH